MGQGRIVEFALILLEQLVDLLADLVEMQPRQVLGVGRNGRRPPEDEDEAIVAEEWLVFRAQDHGTEPLDVLALEVAPDGGDRVWRRPIRRRVNLAEDAVGERPEDLGDLDRIAARIALELLILDSLEHTGIEALI